MRRITCPAERVIRKCGNGNIVNGLSTVSGWCGVHISRVRRWMLPKDGNGDGTGGLIPTRHQQTILQRAQALGIPLEAQDFFFTLDELVVRPQGAEAAA